MTARPRPVPHRRHCQRQEHRRQFVRRPRRADHRHRSAGARGRGAGQPLLDETRRAFRHLRVLEPRTAISTRPALRTIVFSRPRRTSAISRRCCIPRSRADGSSQCAVAAGGIYQILVIPLLVENEPGRTARPGAGGRLRRGTAARAPAGAGWFTVEQARASWRRRPRARRGWRRRRRASRTMVTECGLRDQVGDTACAVSGAGRQARPSGFGRRAGWSDAARARLRAAHGQAE